MTKTVQIGVGHHDYSARRCFRGAKLDDIAFTRQLPVPPRRMWRYIPFFKRYSGSAVFFLPNKNIAAYHTFNEVVLNRKPWFVTCESVLPRLWDQPKARRYLLSILARDYCRQILPISKNALVHLRTRNEDHPAIEQILAKTTIIYPGVEDDRHAYEMHEKYKEQTREKVRLLFVGNEFFRKGGQLSVGAFERLKKNYPVELTVVSSMNEKNYVHPTQPGEAAKWIKRMQDAGVRHLQNISFSEVRRELAHCDALLLPTMDDSFGFSIVEAMATGVIPIASAIRAIPEIVTDQKNGVLFDVPTTREGRLDMTSLTLRGLENTLTQKLEWFIESRDLHASMSRSARLTYETKFSANCLAQNLSELYRKHLDG